MQKVIAKIHLTNIIRNARAFRAQTNAKLCAVVKADAYGHGVEEVTLALSGIADCFAVALIDEGLVIKAAACGKDILVFTPPTSEEECYALAANAFVASLPNLYTAKLFLRICEKYEIVGRVHLKVNTGMNRYGMNASTLGKVCKLLKDSPWVQVEGIYSHLYTTDFEISQNQRLLFLQMERVCRRYFPSVTAHLSATYGATLGEAFAFDMVRIGIGLYGYAPIEVPFPLYKGMEVFAKVVDARRYAFGGAGYGEMKGIERGDALTALRVGYADGFLRQRTNGLGGGENANNLCMDMCIKKGKKPRGALLPVMTDAEVVARETNTICYEVLCAATRRAEKIYD